MINLDQEIADVAADVEACRGRGIKTIFSDDIKRRAAGLYHRRGEMTLIDLSRRLKISPGAVRKWAVDLKPDRRRASDMIPLKVVGHGGVTPRGFILNKVAEAGLGHSAKAQFFPK